MSNLQNLENLQELPCVSCSDAVQPPSWIKPAQVALLLTQPPTSQREIHQPQGSNAVMQICCKCVFKMRTTVKYLLWDLYVSPLTAIY